MLTLAVRGCLELIGKHSVPWDWSADDFMMFIALVLVCSVLLIGMWVKPQAKKESHVEPEVPPRTSIHGIEVVVSAVIILILAAMLLPPLGGVREDRRRSLCESNLRQIWQALAIYAGQNNGRYPDQGLWQLWQGGYASSGNIFICPDYKARSAKNVDEFKSGNHCGYLYFPAQQMQKTGNAKVLMLDKPDNHVVRDNWKEFGHVLFTDGTIKGYGGKQWWLAAGQTNLGIGVDR
jgi:type II secretory pathway pseudopilin PulG